MARTANLKRLGMVRRKKVGTAIVVEDCKPPSPSATYRLRRRSIDMLTRDRGTEELSEEDQQLKNELDMLVERLLVRLFRRTTFRDPG